MQRTIGQTVLLFKTASDKQSGEGTADDFLLLHYYKYSGIWHYCVVCWLLCCRTDAKLLAAPCLSFRKISSSRCLSRAGNLIKVRTHPGYELFGLLPSGRCYSSSKTRANRLKIVSFPRPSGINTGF